VRAAVRRCGPISLPNHKLIPDVRWLADLPSSKVIARSDPRQAKRIQNGVAIYVLGRYALFRQAWVSEADDPRNQIPLPGFVRVATSRYYSAYIRCDG
jgi:hypothetical protein